MRDGPLFNGSVPYLIYAMLHAPEVSMRAGQIRAWLRAYPNNPAARKAMSAQAKWRKAM